jgi:hypothetical protein
MDLTSTPHDVAGYPLKVTTLRRERVGSKVMKSKGKVGPLMSPPPAPEVL